MKVGVTVLEDMLAEEFFREMETIPTVDAHEHLPAEEERLRKDADFYTLFEHYCLADLVAAGAGEQELAEFADRSIAEDVRWRKFSPYLSRIRTGSYARAALIVVCDLLGVADLTDDTYAEVGSKLRALLRPGFYEWVLREKCNIATCIQSVDLAHREPQGSYHLAPSTELVDVAGQKDIERISTRLSRDVRDLGDLLDHMDARLAEWEKDPQVVGVKCPHAYSRSIEFKPVERADAERVLQRVLSARRDARPSDAIVLQDYLMFALAGRLAGKRLVLAIHTGLQAGNNNRIARAHPLNLQALIEANPNTRFDLFHGGTPWTREAAVLAKYFRNVYLNLAWLHIISPAQSREALSEWLDMVPNNKIIGFGGDYAIVEKVYGHLKIARATISNVLAEKVRGAGWSRADALVVAHRLMQENACKLYGLSLT